MSPRPTTPNRYRWRFYCFTPGRRDTGWRWWVADGLLRLAQRLLPRSVTILTLDIATDPPLPRTERRACIVSGLKEMERGVAQATALAHEDRMFELKYFLDKTDRETDS